VSSTRKCSQELLWIQVVFEGLPSVNEHYRNFFVVSLSQLCISIDVDLAPFEIVLPRKLCELLLYNVAKVTSLA